jgi:hypothetical protein
MSKRVFMGHIAVVGGHRVSREAPSFTLQPGRARLDGTVMEDGAETYELGLHTVEVGMPGAFANSEADKRWVTELGTTPAPHLPITLQLVPGNGTVNDDVAMLDSCTPGVKWTRERGKLAMYDLSLVQHEPLVLGKLLYTSIGTAGLTGVTTGTGVLLGPLLAAVPGVSLGWVLTVHFHVLNYPPVSGTTPALIGRIESSAIGDFTDAMTRITFNSANATPKGEIYTLDGDVLAIADQTWRFKTLAPTGTGSPTFYVLVAASLWQKQAS